MKNDEPMQNGEHETVVRWLEKAANADVNPRATEVAIAKTRHRLTSHRTPNHPSAFLGKAMIMLSKTAAVLVPVVVLVVWLSSWQSASFAFGDVQDKIEATTSIAFESNDGTATEPTKIALLGPYRERRVTESGDIIIRDIKKGTMLILNPKLKTAVRIRGDGNNLTLYDYVRNIDENKAKRLPGKQLSGTQVIGFRSVEHQEQIVIETTVWADPTSKLPVQIERTWTDTNNQAAIREVLTKFVFDMSPNESLFALDPPDGYSIEGKEAGPAQSAFTPTEDVADDK